MTVATNFNTADRIIREAMINAGLLQDGELPSGEQYLKYFNRLNDLVNLWQTQGLKLWLNQTLSVTLVAGTATYTLTGAPKRVLEGYYVDSNSISRPLNTLSWHDYLMLSDRTDQGAVNSYFVDKRQSVASGMTTVVSVWLVPDTTAATGTLQLLVQVPVTNSVSLTDNMNFPNEWYMALHWGLADEICTGQPEAIMQRCAIRAKTYREALEDWDVEDASTSFAPNTQQRQGSRFT